VKRSKPPARNAGNDAPKRSLCEGGMLSVPAAAAFISVSRTKLYELMACGRIPYSRIDGRRVVPKLALVELAERSLVAPEAA
jgi:hypothetical protein